MGFLDYLLLAGLAAAVTAVVVYLRRQRKKGHCVGCSCADCSLCPHANPAAKESSSDPDKAVPPRP